MMILNFEGPIVFVGLHWVYAALGKVVPTGVDFFLKKYFGTKRKTRLVAGSSDNHLHRSFQFTPLLPAPERDMPSGEADGKLEIKILYP